MYVYKHNNVCMSIDMVIENSELNSAPLHRSDRRPHSFYSSALRGRIRDIPPVTGSLTGDLGCLDIRTGIAYICQ